MMYLSVYQSICDEIKKETDLGKKLVASKRPRALNNKDDGLDDPFCEAEYSAAHFDQHLVMELVGCLIKQGAGDARFILLEGLCNNSRLADA